MRILSKSLFPSIKMGGASKLLGYINMHTSTGLAKVKTTQGCLIVRINQGLHTEHDSEEEMDHKSLFCIAQAREHGINVNDKPQRYGGQQNIIIEEGDETYVIPLTYDEGICIIPHMEPTDK